jgi:hypothetical protein
LVRSLGVLRAGFDPRGLPLRHPFQRTRAKEAQPEMKAYAKSYLVFLAFMVATKAVVAPLASKFNVPLIQDL